jgi:NADPH-dependent 2,4-dienoyl-CoA reductase/sulfur reductase-like enzyme
MFLKNATATWDGADHSDDVDNVTFTPNVTTATFTPISGNSKSESTESWTLSFNLAQDFTADSLYMKLHAGGEPKELVFKPRGAEVGGAVITATVVPAPAVIGGGVGALTATATCAVNGKPVITPATV